METNRKIWTLEEVAARRATGDSLVTHGGWCASYMTGGASKGAVLHLYRVAIDAWRKWTHEVVERDPRDGHVFESTDHAQLYALNAGRLMWFRDWEVQQTIA